MVPQRAGTLKRRLALSKIPVTHIAAVGIIFPAHDPTYLFLEIKDDGHPIKLVRRQLCFIGGTWIGDNAKQDSNTFDTFRRELGEELSFERPVRDSIELNHLGLSDVECFAPIPQPTVTVTPVDREKLDYLKKIIVEYAIPFGDFMNVISKNALDGADPTNKRDGFTALVSYWAVPLQEDVWGSLLELQRKFGNLSNESITLVTSLDEIIRTNTKISFGHDRVLKKFFLDFGLRGAQNLPLVPGISVQAVGMPLPTYQDYLAKFDVAKTPL